MIIDKNDRYGRMYLFLIDFVDCVYTNIFIEINLVKQVYEKSSGIIFLCVNL